MDCSRKHQVQTKEEAMRVGFIGLGNMGGPLAGFVLKAGFSLVVHDIRREGAATLLEQGAIWADSPRDAAAQCDVICICVPGPPEMQAVALAAHGLLEALNSGSAVIDHTPNSPATARHLG